jgi:hypothetical protein
MQPPKLENNFTVYDRRFFNCQNKPKGDSPPFEGGVAAPSKK